MSVHGLPKGLHDLPSWLIPVKPAALVEATARGLGYRTNAARIVEEKNQSQGSRVFNGKAFELRLAELSEECSASAISAVLKGARLSIKVTKMADARQRSRSDTAYDIEVMLSGVAPTLLDSDILFRLPQFGRGASNEPYRVDSGHDRREISDYSMFHHGGGNTRVAKLVRGHWHGGFFVYAPEHQANDERCIQSVKMALTRAILSKLPTQVRCSMFKPDGYAPRAWRVEMRLTPALMQLMNGSPFLFDIPKFPQWKFHPKSAYIYNGPETGRFVDGVWVADLYSNNIDEELNRNRRIEVWRELLDAVQTTAELNGYREDPA